MRSEKGSGDSTPTTTALFGDNENAVVRRLLVDRCQLGALGGFGEVIQPESNTERRIGSGPNVQYRSTTRLL